MFDSFILLSRFRIGSKSHAWGIYITVFSWKFYNNYILLSFWIRQKEGVICMMHPWNTIPWMHHADYAFLLSYSKWKFYVWRLVGVIKWLNIELLIWIVAVEKQFYHTSCHNWGVFSDTSSVFVLSWIIYKCWAGVEETVRWSSNDVV